MRSFLDRLPYPPLVVAAVFLAIAPITPQPHLLEKLSMLTRGELTRPIDILDLFFHALPLGLLVLKLVVGRPSREN
jgi:hypothetical protein